MPRTVVSYVEVDIGDVLSELSDDDLKEEMESRGLIGLSAVEGSSKDFMRDIEEAARAGRAFDLLAIVQSWLPPLPSACTPTPYESLKRDPASGRPVIQ